MIHRRYSVRIGKRLQNKLERWDDELAGLGIEIEIHHRRKLKKVAHWASAVSTVQDLWLLYQVSKAAVGHWPQIRDFLKSHGFKREEIVTLGLSKATRPTPKSTMKKKPAKRK
jgi:hypothetical protein